MAKLKKGQMFIPPEEQYKAMKRGRYKARKEVMGDGWERSTEVHKSKKDYNRRLAKRVDLNND